MNEIFNQSKNKRIIVISFQSLSQTSNPSNNVFELFASFKAVNALTHWNLSLIHAVQNCVLVGHIDPHVIMLGGNNSYLEIIKLAWMKQILKSPFGFEIQYLGELCNFLVSKTPQCSSLELEEAVCKCVCELVNNGIPSNLRNIIRHVKKFLPVLGESDAVDNEYVLSNEMITSIIDGLQGKGLIYNTGHGYNVMTADKVRVAKWLGELPDMSISLSGSEIQEKKAAYILQKPNNKFKTNRELLENTDDCRPCYDLRGNKYYTQPLVDQKLIEKESHYSQVYDCNRTNCLNEDLINGNAQIVPTDTSLNKHRMLCSHSSKKDLPKRPRCVKYESSFINRIICGMKKFRIHWPIKNGVARSANVGIQNVHNKTYSMDVEEDQNVINSRLCKSMYAFNPMNGHSSESQQSNILDNKYLNLDNYRSDYIQNDQFNPCREAKSISPVADLGGYGISYVRDQDRSFVLMDEQRCCSELMLTACSSVLSPNIYPIVPFDRISTSDGMKAKADHKNHLLSSTINEKTLNPSINRYFSPFTCDSGFNSVHGTGLPENETNHSKTSSPPDNNNSKNFSHLRQTLYGGPCAWQVNSLNDCFYQSRNYPSSGLAPVIETSRFMK